MAKVRVIEVKENVFSSLNEEADLVRDTLAKQGTYFINFMSSPGSGKTTLLSALINYLKDQCLIKEMDVDIKSSKDAQTVSDKTGVECLQINNGGLCHIDSDMVSRVLTNYDTKGTDLLILENIGNLVCPAEFDTGAHENYMILSIPEGDDKPLKYPLMFTKADVVIFSKIDTLPYFDFDLEKAKSHILNLNPNAKFFVVSAKTMEGIKDLGDYILKNVKSLRTIRRANQCDIANIDSLLYQVHDVHSTIRNDIFKKGQKKYTDDELKSIIDNDATPIFVEVDRSNNLLGYCFCIEQITKNSNSLMDRKVLYIDDLCVDEKARGNHVATSLFKYVENYAKANHFDALTLNVWEGNNSAYQFYKKSGFNTLKTTMEKKL